MKKIIKIVLWILGIVLVALVVLPLWIGPVVKVAVGIVGPRITQTNVHLGRFALNPYTGTLKLGDFQVENPAGHKQREALTVGNLEVEVEPLSLMTDVIHVRLIRVQDLFMSYMVANGRSNADELMANAGIGGNESKTAADAPKACETTTEPVAQKKSSKRVIIDRVEVSGVLFQTGPITLPLTPKPIVLTNIGTSSGGIGMDNAWEEISGSVMKSAGVVGDSLKKGLDLGKEGFDSALESVKKAAMKGAEKTLRNTGKQLESLGKGLGDGFKNMFK